MQQSLKSSYLCKHKEVESTCCEYFFIEIPSDNMNKNIILGNLYRPPRNLKENYLSFMREITSMYEKTKTAEMNLF